MLSGIPFSVAATRENLSPPLLCRVVRAATHGHPFAYPLAIAGRGWRHDLPGTQRGGARSGPDIADLLPIRSR